MELSDGDGQDRRDAQGRVQAADPHRPRQAGGELFRRWCEAAGCAVKVDEMGNMFARCSGEDNSLAPVMMGSHLDTQPTGGKFDGVLGVLGALEVVRSLNDLKIKTRRPIEVANWTNEEGSRFAPAIRPARSPIYGKEYRLFPARQRRQVARRRTRPHRLQGRGAGRRAARNANFELHIEQGPILEDENVDVGVVTHGQGQRWYEIRLTGFESHAGSSTPMPRRKDALLGAARIVELVNTIGLGNAPLGVSTVGMLNPYPNRRNVIPGEVFMTCEFRHPADETLSGMDAVLREGVDTIAAKIGLAVRPEAGFLLPAGRLRPRLRRRRAAGRHAFRLYLPEHRVRRRPRRLLHRTHRANLDDLHPLRRRRQPQRDRGHQAGMVLTARANVLMHAVLEKAEIVS